MDVLSLDDWLDRTILPGYTRLGYRLRGDNWASAVAGDLSGSAALVTGASSGLGEAAVEGLARAGADVHMLVRNRERGEQARARVLERLDEPAWSSGSAPVGELHVQLCDLADLDAVREFAARFRPLEARLRVLVNNAGVMATQRQESADGIELTFATNVVAPFLLTALLLPALEKNPPSRVITVSSGGMYASRLQGDDLQLSGRDFDPNTFYAHTKRAEVILTELAAERCARAGVTFHSMHPGWADTPGLRDSLPGFARWMRPLLRSTREGADTIVWLATAPDGGRCSGRFWHDRRPRPTHRVPWTKESVHDRDRLWAECERLSGLAAPAS